MLGLFGSAADPDSLHASHFDRNLGAAGKASSPSTPKLQNIALSRWVTHASITINALGRLIVTFSCVIHQVEALFCSFGMPGDNACVAAALYQDGI